MIGSLMEYSVQNKFGGKQFHGWWWCLLLYWFCCFFFFLLKINQLNSSLNGFCMHYKSEPFFYLIFNLSNILVHFHFIINHAITTSRPVTVSSMQILNIRTWSCSILNVNVSVSLQYSYHFFFIHKFLMVKKNSHQIKI